jgi:hypothetical protein
MELKTISDEAAARSIRTARNRAVYATPGVTDTVAAALIEACGRLGRAKVRVVLDGSANALRLGYGQADSMSMLLEHGVDVRVEPGLRVSLLVVDDKAAVFMLPAMLVEDPNLPRGPNALILPSDQVDGILRTVAPDLSSGQTEDAGGSQLPQIGRSSLSAEQVKKVEAELVNNPPQRFDLARTLNVFNAYVEFIECKRAGNTPREVQATQREVLACQRCGSNSSIRPAGCVGSRVSTSLM